MIEICQPNTNFFSLMFLELATANFYWDLVVVLNIKIII